MKSTACLLIIAILLSSCATAKLPAHDLSDLCGREYESAQQGEKEALAGTILLPVGVGLMTVVATPMLYAGSWVSEPPPDGNDNDTGMRPLPAIAVTFYALGAAAIVSGIVLLADGHVRVNDWNFHCSGATPAERYCLFDDAAKLNGR